MRIRNTLILVASMAIGVSMHAQQHAVRTIEFAEQSWRVKRSIERAGPGPNYFSDGTNHVWVDPSGRLHLRITRQGDKWACAEVVSEKSFGYGTYQFEIAGQIAHLDRTAVLGLFTWSDQADFANREIDIEFSRWGKDSETNNVQFVVQPYDLQRRMFRFRLRPDYNVSTHRFDWQPGVVRFESQGLAAPAEKPDLATEWRAREGVPPPGGEHVRMNLWLFRGEPPADGKDVEVVITAFKHTPPPR